LTRRAEIDVAANLRPLQSRAFLWAANFVAQLKNKTQVETQVSQDINRKAQRPETEGK